MLIFNSLQKEIGCPIRSAKVRKSFGIIGIAKHRLFLIFLAFTIKCILQNTLLFNLCIFENTFLIYFRILEKTFI